VRVGVVGVRSGWLVWRLHPSLLFATGGFVALPPAVAPRALGIPIVVHEQTAVPGLANRVGGRFACRIALSFPATGGDFPAERTTLTGNPLRSELVGRAREAAGRQSDLDAATPIVYVTGGSQGSHKINRTVGEVLQDLLAMCQIIHQCGDNPDTGDRHWLADRARTLEPTLRQRYVLLPYVGRERRHAYAAPDLVIGPSRAAP